MAKPGLILAFDLDQTLIDTDSLHSNNAWNPGYLQKIPCALNYKLIDSVIVPAVMLRKERLVDAIFLLTNNGNPPFITACCKAIHDHVKTQIGNPEIVKGKYEQIQRYAAVMTQPLDMLRDGYIFDNVMTLDHPHRNPYNKIIKSFDDIRTLIDGVNMVVDPKDIITGAKLMDRTYFFDDNAYHIIKQEMFRAGMGEHYLEVLPNKPGAHGFSLLNPGSCTKELTDVTSYDAVIKQFNKAIRRNLTSLHNKMNRPPLHPRRTPPSNVAPTAKIPPLFAVPTQATVAPTAKLPPLFSPMPQASMPQASMPQASMPQASMPQAEMPTARMPIATAAPMIRNPLTAKNKNAAYKKAVNKFYTLGLTKPNPASAWSNVKGGRKTRKSIMKRKRSKRVTKSRT